ncbi:DL-methionine transporter subunit; ATP-binding component of ABC superfamily (plasmid) [Cupriavidus taiwanensis]|uniref:Cell division ATP-binding protein FtsE n=1 Tax=Cupriavidus taiwanensis TaxID=164546 RepID=A0A375IRG7_9BURK|nr:ATP-binding cassette domain-containing protein [Cupriavidus taiwanensis]SPK77157.1 DL-methionine transporter subunit; ATP-binding component of ABC superfamily [Cupriavidus taiwanensis]
MILTNALLRRGFLPVAPPGDTTTAARDGHAQAAAGSVRFERVSKHYASGAGAVQALSDIDLDIPPGGIFGIIGRSGAGKSTLLRTINRLEAPTGGRVLVDGQDIAALDESGLVALRRRIGMIFQHFNLLSAKTVRENVALPLKVAGAPRDAIARRVDEVIALVGLEGKHDTYPGRLSGGQKQRVGIARALVHRPEILLCDEATSALDPETTQSILQLLRDINQRLGLTIVLITHEMRVIREICDQVLVLERGAIAETGPVWQVFGNPLHAATQALLAPLTPGLPEDIAARLLPEPPAGPHRRIAELRYSGSGDHTPDLASLAAGLGTDAQLLHGSLDRIQGRTQGKLLLSLAGTGAHCADAPISRYLKTLGYVADSY